MWHRSPPAQKRRRESEPADRGREAQRNAGRRVQRRASPVTVLKQAHGLVAERRECCVAADHTNTKKGAPFGCGRRTFERGVHERDDKRTGDVDQERTVREFGASPQLDPLTDGVSQHATEASSDEDYDWYHGVRGES